MPIYVVWQLTKVSLLLNKLSFSQGSVFRHPGEHDYYYVLRKNLSGFTCFGWDIGSVLYQLK